MLELKLPCRLSVQPAHRACRAKSVEGIDGSKQSAEPQIWPDICVKCDIFLQMQENCVHNCLGCPMTG